MRGTACALALIALGCHDPGVPVGSRWEFESFQKLYAPSGLYADETTDQSSAPQKVKSGYTHEIGVKG